MKIVSEDRKSELSLQKHDPSDSYSPFSLKAKLTHNNNVFEGANDKVQFSNFELSLVALEKFLIKRNGEVIFDMSEDCKISFFKWNQKGDVGLKVKVCKNVLVAESAKYAQWCILGEMKLNAEFLTQMLDELKALK